MSIFDRSYANGTGKGRSLSEAIKPLVPMTTLFVVATAWAYYSPGDILETHLRVFLLMMSFIFSNITVSRNMKYVDSLEM